MIALRLFLESGPRGIRALFSLVRESGPREEILGRDLPSPGSRPETCPKVAPEDPFDDFVGGSWGGASRHVRGIGSDGFRNYFEINCTGIFPVGGDL